MKAPTYGKRGGLQAFDRGARKVSHAFGRSTVLTHGLKANGGVALESDSERLFAHMLNLDPDVVSYSAQPFAVELTTGSIAHSDEEKDALRTRVKRHGGKAVFYTPDFGIVWATGIQAAVEVKLARFLGDDEYQRKLKLAGDILLGHGCEFLQLVMPGHWRHPLRTNLPLLHQAHMRRGIWSTPEIDVRLLKAIDSGDILPAGQATSVGELEFLQADVATFFSAKTVEAGLSVQALFKATGWKWESISHWIEESLLESVPVVLRGQPCRVVFPEHLIKFSGTYVPLTSLARSLNARSSELLERLGGIKTLGGKPLARGAVRGALVRLSDLAQAALLPGLRERTSAA